MLDSYWSNTIANLETLLLERKNAQVSLEIKKLLVDKPPREALAPMAAIARRAGFPYLSLRILQPLFRQEGRAITGYASDYETLIYGSALIVLGAKTEGLTLFKKLDVKILPEVLLFRANSLISEWKYLEALPILEEYLLYDELRPIQRLVGNLNLCSCYIVAKKSQKFKTVISESYTLAEITRASHLKLSVVELEAQFYFYQNDFVRTQEIIKKYFPTGISNAQTIFEALLQKWDLLSQVYLCKNSDERDKIITSIGKFSLYCRDQQYWEVYRDCDFHYGLLSASENHIFRAYFGTPYKEYRKNLLSQIKGKLEIPKIWNSSDTEFSNHINRTTATYKNLEIIEPYKRQWSLFFLLTQDLYRPISLGRLYNELFPDEYFVKSQAAHRIQQLISQLRQSFHTSNIDTDILVNRNSYHLKTQEPLLFQNTDVIFRSHQDYLIHQILQQKDVTYLTAIKIQSQYKISRNLALDILRKMIDKGLIVKIPKGRETIYQFAKSGRRNL